MLISSTANTSVSALTLTVAHGSSSAAVPAPEIGTDFSSLLGSLASGAAASLQSGEVAALSAAQGGMPLQTIVEKVMAAERTLQATLALRDKAVTAYLEISRMQI
jgi:flagellar hook-basal body complex protein FliE